MTARYKFKGLAAVNSLIAGLFAFALSSASFAQDSQANPVTLLAFGDSLTEGFGLSDPNDGFTFQLERALEGVTVINAGFAGDTTQGGLDRLAWSLFDNPDAVILQLGANDMLRGFDPATTRANLDSLLAQLVATELPVLFVGMQATPSMGEDFKRDFDGLFGALAAQYADQGVLFYPFFLDGVVVDPALNQADGIHPNAAGVKIIVERIAPKVQELVELAQAAED